MVLNLDLIGALVAALLTLITLSYVIGDHPIFRVVLHLFIGVAAGYAAAVAVQDIVLPQLIFPILDEIAGTPSMELTELGVRGVLTVFLLMKLSPRTARLGNPVMALLVGVGAALAIGGAVQGTLLPQVGAAASIFDVGAFYSWLEGGYYGNAIPILLEGFIMLLAIVSSLAYFHFGARARGKQDPQRNIFVDVLAWVGAIFIAIALAALFSGVLLSALGALIERLSFLLSAIQSLFGTP